MSCWTTTVPNSVRNRAPVGQTSRQPASVQCLHTSDSISQRKSVRVSAPVPSPGRPKVGMPRSATAPPGAVGSGVVPSSAPPRGAARSRGSTAAVTSSNPTVPGRRCSTNATCRHEFAPSIPVLSIDMPSRSRPSSGTWFHSLQATSHALHPMHTDVSVKKPTRGGGSSYPFRRARSTGGEGVGAGVGTVPPLGGGSWRGRGGGGGGGGGVGGGQRRRGGGGDPGAAAQPLEKRGELGAARPA